MSSKTDKSSLQSLDKYGTRSRNASEEMMATSTEVDFIQDQLTFIKNLSNIPDSNVFYNATNENDMNTDEMIQLLARLHTSTESSHNTSTFGNGGYSLSSSLNTNHTDDSPYSDFFQQLKEV